MPLLVSELKGWCRGEDVAEAHAVMVLIPDEVNVSAIEDTMHTVKSLGRVRVRGRTFSMRHNSYLVLCECREVVQREHVPFEVFATEGGKAWTVVIAEEGPVNSEPDFSQKVTELLQAEGKTMSDLRTLFGTEEAAANPTESFMRAMTDFLSQTSKPPSDSSYRCLRVFSGSLPTPAGEESFDHWLGQAKLMIEECDCAPKEKRRRLMESLRGSALEIVKAARASDPEISPENCLEALEHAFGTAESGDDLYFAFRLLRQQTGEKLSDFLRRLEQSLSRVVKRGGLPPGGADRARLEQLLRGAVSSDFMLLSLRLRERKEKPPTFLQLLKEIREEEEYEASRKKINPIKELKSLLAAAVSKPAHVQQDGTEKPPPKALSGERCPDSEMTVLKKEVKRLQQKVTQKVTEPRATVAAVDVSKPVASSPQRSSKGSDEHFCYRCGENGHYASKCQNPEN
uniref:CCHC-type domain-containing protein n=1 Tax=Salarias fasciatus TaxID=181472 RepID=A0A672F765_SALFA